VVQRWHRYRHAGTLTGETGRIEHGPHAVLVCVLGIPVPVSVLLCLLWCGAACALKRMRQGRPVEPCCGPGRRFAAPALTSWAS
jgi:hypothetical protein